MSCVCIKEARGAISRRFFMLVCSQVRRRHIRGSRTNGPLLRGDAPPELLLGGTSNAQLYLRCVAGGPEERVPLVVR